MALFKGKVSNFSVVNRGKKCYNKKYENTKEGMPL